MKKVFIYCGFVAGIFFTSCTNDLDVISEDIRVLSPEIQYTSEAGYKQALAGVYGNLVLTGTGDAGSSFLQGIDAGTSQFARCLFYLQNLTTDEVIWSYENDEGVADLQRNRWNSTNPIILGMFSRTMAEVALANEFLRQSTPSLLQSRGITSETDISKINDYRNEARALRAFAYYIVMDLYGKAPFITENDPLNFAGPEYNREQLFTFIESELTEILPALKAPRTNEYGRVDKAFAWMILAKMYLNAEVYIQQNKYTECMDMCTNIINSGFQLNPEYKYNFNADNHTSPEIIFGLQSDGVVTQSYGATTVIINGQVGSIENNGNDFGVGGWGGALRLRQQFVDKFEGPYFAFDARNSIITGNATTQRPKEIVNPTAQGQGYVLGKWSNKTSAGIAGPNSTFVDTDFPLFRLADVYLMYAEAQMRKDGASNNSNTANATPQSLTYINALRERANAGDPFANVAASEVTLQFILDERSRELHWEAHRRQDLIRFGRYTGGSYNWAWKGNGINGVSIPAYFSVFPLPFDAIKSNRNLTQNTGY